MVRLEVLGTRAGERSLQQTELLAGSARGHLGESVGRLEEEFDGFAHLADDSVVVALEHVTQGSLIDPGSLTSRCVETHLVIVCGLF